MKRFTKMVEVIGRVEFERINEHTRKPIVETFVAITMRTNEGLFVNYTRVDTKFAQSTPLGDKFMVSGQLVEFRNDEYGEHWKVSHCKRGHFKENKIDKRREARKQARLAKLGLA